MTAKEIYSMWAPEGAKWVDWTRPVPFIPIDNKLKTFNTVIDSLLPTINYSIPPKTAVIVDLPGCDGIREGLSLAKLGFRPIPVYNGTIEQSESLATTDNTIISEGLFSATPILSKLDLANDANPAFLLDTSRLNRFKMNVSVFDNSWDIYDQDLPTGEYFKNNNIDNILVHSDKIHKDLKLILRKYRKAGLKIYFVNSLDEEKELKLIKKQV